MLIFGAQFVCVMLTTKMVQLVISVVIYVIKICVNGKRRSIKKRLTDFIVFIIVF